MSHAVEGVFCAASTPVTPEGEPIVDLFAAHCRALIDEGCHGVAMLGTTGEAMSFGLNQRLALLDGVLEAGIPATALVPGTSAASLGDAVTLTRAAVKAGVRGALVLPPFYYKAPSDEGLYRYYARLIEGVGDDRLKVILYHIPQMSMVPISHDLIERLLTAFPGIVVGIKDSSGVLENMLAMCERFPDLGVLTGADAMLRQVLEKGGAGCITGASNLGAKALRRVWDNWQDPAKAAEVAAAEEEVKRWRALCVKHAQLPGTKALLAKRRGDMRWLSTLPPLVDLGEAERLDLWAELEALGG